MAICDAAVEATPLIDGVCNAGAGHVGGGTGLKRTEARVASLQLRPTQGRQLGCVVASLAALPLIALCVATAMVFFPSLHTDHPHTPLPPSPMPTSMPSPSAGPAHRRCEGRCEDWCQWHTGVEKCTWKTLACSACSECPIAAASSRSPGRPPNPPAAIAPAHPSPSARRCGEWCDAGQCTSKGVDCTARCSDCAARAASELFLSTAGVTVRVVFGVSSVDCPVPFDAWGEDTSVVGVWEENFDTRLSPGAYLSTSVLRHDLPIALASWTNWLEEDPRQYRLGLVIDSERVGRGCSFWSDANSGSEHRQAPGKDWAEGYRLCDVADAAAYALEQREILLSRCRQGASLLCAPNWVRCGQCCNPHWESTLATMRLIANSSDPCLAGSGWRASHNEMMSQYNATDVLALFYSTYEGEPLATTKAICGRARRYQEQMNALSRAAGLAARFGLLQLKLPVRYDSPDVARDGTRDSAWVVDRPRTSPFRIAEC